MTRKDFEQIARSIRTLHGIDEQTRRNIAWQFANDLQFTNTRFDKDRFVKACLTLESVHTEGT
jgi:hypothetical protein